MLSDKGVCGIEKLLAANELRHDQIPGQSKLLLTHWRTDGFSPRRDFGAVTSEIQRGERRIIQNA